MPPKGRQHSPASSRCIRRGTAQITTPTDLGRSREVTEYQLQSPLDSRGRSRTRTLVMPAMRSLRRVRRAHSLSCSRVMRVRLLFSRARAIRAVDNPDPHSTTAACVCRQACIEASRKSTLAVQTPLPHASLVRATVECVAVPFRNWPRTSRRACRSSNARRAARRRLVARMRIRSDLS